MFIRGVSFIGQRKAVMHFKWTAEVGDSLSCLCEASGDMCFTDKALNATVSHIYQR